MRPSGVPHVEVLVVGVEQEDQPVRDGPALDGVVRDGVPEPEPPRGLLVGKLDGILARARRLELLGAHVRPDRVGGPPGLPHVHHDLEAVDGGDRVLQAREDLLGARRAAYHDRPGLEVHVLGL